MAYITLVPHQAYNVMASMASLFIILAVTNHIQAAKPIYDVPDTFPQTKTAEAQHQLPNLEDIMNGFDELCPPLGLSTERFNVQVMGSHSPPIGGCASMQTVRHDIIPAFNLWLGNVQNGGGSCDETDMDHYMFECLSKHPFIEDNDIKGWFVTLYDRTAKWTGQKDYKCGLYSMILEDPPTIKLVISANRTCEGLSQIMENDVHTVSEGLRHFHDGSVALLLTKDWPHPFSSSDVWRKKRSALKDDVYRFPDWSQGSWLDLQVDGSIIRYDTAFHEKEDIDYEEDSDYGKDEDADISGSELYMQRSQRYNPVGISGRNRRSIPNMNGVKMLRTRITTIQNNTRDKFWLKHQLLNDMQNLDLFNFRREHSSALSEKQKSFLEILTKLLTISVESPPDLFRYEDYTTKKTPENTTVDMNDNSLKIPLNLNRFRSKRDIMNEPETANEETKLRKKRCFGNAATTTTAPYRDLDFENPPKAGDPFELFDKTNKYFGTTRSPDNRSIKKRMSTNKYLDLFNFQRKRRSALPEKQKSFLNLFVEFLPVLVESPPDLFGFGYYTTKKTPVSTTTNVNDQSLKTPLDLNRFRYKRDLIYPEGTVEDQTDYRALNLPGGYRIESRLSRPTMFEKKQLDPISESATADSHFQNIQSNSINGQRNILKVNKRMRRSSTQHSQQQRATTKFTWRCIMPVDNDEKQLNSHQVGAKFLTYGGRIMEKTAENDNHQHNEPKSDTLFDIKEDSKMSYGCLWLVPRGPNIIEFSIIGTGLPDKYQDIKSFARQLCTEKKPVDKDSNVRNMKKLHPRRHSWITETRADEGKRVAVGCPIPLGTVFYGEIPAPPPPSTITNNSQPAPPRLCVRLISSADDCTNGQAGPIDQMKYTVSECVERDSSTGTFPQIVATEQTIFEASRGYAVGGSWRRNKRHSASADTLTTVSTVATTPTSSNTSMLPGHSISTGSTATSSTATTSSSITPGSSKGSQNAVDITTVDPTTFNTTTTTTTATAFSTDTSSTLLLSSPQQTTSPERQLPLFLTSSISTTTTTTTTTTPPPPLNDFTSTSTVTTTTTHYPGTDYNYRQQQQWQQQHSQPNHNNNDYYNQGRQQHYPPPPPGSTGIDHNYYYLQRQQQQWQHQHPQTQLYWSSQQHDNGANDYGNGYQQQITNGGAHRTGDYYYRQQQQNYYNHQYDNGRQQQTPQPRNTSLMVQHPIGGGWNVHGDRPLYISSGGGGGDNNREIPVARNSSASVSSSNNGGWATPEQQHWWYQQQQQRQQEQQKQYQQWQQQNNRGLGGILSLPPVPLPPLHVEQGPVTVSMPTSPPLHLRRPQKPPDHYFLPTLTTKTTINHPHRLRPKSESRYYEEREYKCLGQWTEPQQHIYQEPTQKPIMLTYMYVKRLNPTNNGADQFECFVGTIIPNDKGANPETTTTLMLTEAGSRTLCSRRSDPYQSGMKLVGTKMNKEGASFTSRQNERRPPPKTNNSIRTVPDKKIIILLAFILFSEHLNNIGRRYFN
ncbi:uncharacterized protein LOC113559949 isoform X2 [Rhopalosiphum maidis]|uniref:uncharacterized protein LOC113559949 isoform X2 n=1 Tax=Rhopalosiphum maidis TaxID=43146 RepID=UPI000EFDCFF4|nr:uncharacterized protein LOC113559949 isoform X2 [Rhopalosiphum maidis]